MLSKYGEQPSLEGASPIQLGDLMKVLKVHTESAVPSTNATEATPTPSNTINTFDSTVPTEVHLSKHLVSKHPLGFAPVAQLVAKVMKPEGKIKRASKSRLQQEQAWSDWLHAELQAEEEKEEEEEEEKKATAKEEGKGSMTKPFLPAPPQDDEHSRAKSVRVYKMVQQCARNFVHE
jgi:hypothetical protein